MNLELSENQTAALERELRDVVENDRYPFSPRIRMIREILHMIRPEPLTSGQRSGAQPPNRHGNLYAPIRRYEPLRATAKRHRGG